MLLNVTRWHLGAAQLCSKLMLLLSVPVLLLASVECVAQTNTSIGTFIDVTQPGPSSCTAAAANGTTDDWPAVSCKLSTFTAAGGILFFPAGTYLLNNSITVPPNVSMRGTGYGSVLKQPSSVTGKFVTLQRSSVLRDIKLTQAQPAWGAGAWSPTVYDYQVWASDFDITIENVMLLNPYQGVLVRHSAYPSKPVGQIYIRHLEGQPLKVGIFIDGNADISRFEDIHFWPFWSYTDPVDPNSSKVSDWTQANGTAIASLRNDNPFFSNIFAYRYNYGIWFLQSTGTGVVGITSRPRVSGYDCDACNIGVYVTGAFTNGIEMSNIDLAAGTNVPIYIGADNVSATFTNMDTVNSQVNAVLVNGNNDSIIVANSTIRSWNLSGSGFPAFQVAPGKVNSVLTISNTLYNNGHGGALTGGSTIVTNLLTSAPGLF